MPSDADSAANHLLATLREQIDDLQSQLAFQEDTVQALNDVVASQQRQFDQLALRLQAIEQRTQALADALDGDTPVERPPHY